MGTVFLFVRINYAFYIVSYNYMFTNYTIIIAINFIAAVLTNTSVI